MIEVRCRPIMFEDRSDIFEWRNDPTSRQMSINGDYISSIEHSQWFDAIFKSKSHLGVIGEINCSKIGIVFFYNDNDHVRVSINLNPLFRGKKLAAPLLEGAMHEARLMLPKVKHFFAEIKNTNHASIKIFAQNGFKLVNMNNEVAVYRTK